MGQPKTGKGSGPMVCSRGAARTSRVRSAAEGTTACPDAVTLAAPRL